MRVKHWNDEIRGMSYFVLRQFSILLGTKIYTQICETYNQRLTQQNKSQIMRESKWQLLIKKFA